MAMLRTIGSLGLDHNNHHPALHNYFSQQFDFISSSKEVVLVASQCNKMLGWYHETLKTL
jgi:prophage antirepressor-like protein